MDRKEILEIHIAREKEVVSFFIGVIEEVNQVFLNETDGSNRIPLRVQTVAAFSAIDVLASYWFAFLNKTGRTNKRAEAWYDEFCAKEENKHYLGLWRKVSSERLYKFRNALVHFFGMGEIDPGEIYIALAANDLSDESKEKMERAFLAKGHKTIMFRPKDFFDMIREGAIMMMEQWASIIAEAQTDKAKEQEYIEGIERVWQKIMKEGAKGISREMASLSP